MPHEILATDDAATAVLCQLHLCIQYIELDPWSVGELMTARTMPSVIGIIALLVLTFQMGKTVLGLAQSRSSGEKKISEVDPRSSTETSTPLPTTIAPLAGVALFFGLYIVLIDSLGFTIASVCFLPARLGYSATATFWPRCCRPCVPLLLAGLFHGIGIYLPAGIWLGGLDA